MDLQKYLPLSHFSKKKNAPYKRYITVEITENILTAAIFSIGNKGMDLEKFYQDLPQDGDTYASRGARINSALKQYISKSTYITLLLNPSDYRLALVPKLEGVDDIEQANVYKWKVKDALNIEPLEHTIDVVPLADDSKLNSQVMLVIVKNTVLKDELQILRASKLFPNRIELQETSISTTATYQNPEHKSYALLQVTPKEFLISVWSERKIVSVRTLLKEVVFSNESDRGQALLRVVGEVLRSLDRTSRQFSNLKIESLFIDARSEGKEYVDLFVKEMSIPCYSVTPYGVIKKDVDSVFLNSNGNTLAGASFNSFKDNTIFSKLIPVDLVPAPVAFDFNKVVYSIGGWLLLIGAYGSFVYMNNQNAVNDFNRKQAEHLTQIQTLRTTIDGLNVEPIDLASLKNELDSINKLESSLNSAMGLKNPEFSRWYEYLGKTTPLGVRLSKIEISGNYLSIDGLTSSSDLISNWIDILNQSSFVTEKNIRFELINLIENIKNQKEPLSFTLKTSTGVSK